MTPLTLSLACLVLVGVSGNFISFVRENKILSFISILPSIYILAYGIYLTFGPVDIYEDGTKNFFLQNPIEKELPHCPAPVSVVIFLVPSSLLKKA